MYIQELDHYASNQSSQICRGKYCFGLQARGHLAYLVGGCVRDVIMNITPQDWDICTSALPEEVMELFPGSRPTGLEHGTVTVIIGSKSAEVTTFRTEGDYRDHRRPDSVTFVSDLITDLGRRDFSMNAIALFGRRYACRSV